VDDQSPYRSAKASYQLDMATPIYAQTRAAFGRTRVLSSDPLANLSASDPLPRNETRSEPSSHRSASTPTSFVEVFVLERGTPSKPPRASPRNQTLEAAKGKSPTREPATTQSAAQALAEPVPSPRSRHGRVRFRRSDEDRFGRWTKSVRTGSR
jgi:hypothetical protein